MTPSPGEARGQGLLALTLLHTGALFSFCQGCPWTTWQRWRAWDPWKPWPPWSSRPPWPPWPWWSEYPYVPFLQLLLQKNVASKLLLTLTWLAPRLASSVYTARPWASPRLCNLVESHIRHQAVALRDDFFHSLGFCKESLQLPGSWASVLCGWFVGVGVEAEGEDDWALVVPWKKREYCPWKT